MLQPRRVAVRAIAEHLASQLGEKVGQTIGYRFRGESRVSPQTRLEIVTEGLLTRMLQQDPELAGIGLIIFDEFHERSVHADLSLAFSVEAQQNLREDIRLLVMSATLDVEPILRLLDNADLVQCEGRSYPVETHYRPFAKPLELAQAMASQIIEATRQQQGNVLAFLPGAWEIQKTQRIVEQQLPEDIQVLPLYGALSKAQQLKAIAPTTNGQRKVVLSTNIAETSLTIEGIRVVIDSGVEKVARFDLSKGTNKLQQKAISEASSIQRQGRAGRLGPGICYRLWDREKQARLSKQIAPEILQTDLSPVLLETASWGTTLNDLAILDKPSDAQIDHAHSLLLSLEALDNKSKITSHGRAMAKLGCHPRLANMLLKAKARGESIALLACLVSAVLEGDGRADRQVGVSIHSQLEQMRLNSRDEKWKTAKQWQQRLACVGELKQVQLIPQDIALLTAFAYPDFIAKHVGKNRYVLANGSGASLPDTDLLVGSSWLSIGQLSLGHAANARISLAEPITEGLLQQEFAQQFMHKDVSEWSDGEQRIVAEKRQYFANILLSRQPSAKPGEDDCLQIWQQQIANNGLSWLRWSDETRSLLCKLRLARTFFPDESADFSDVWLLENLHDWCGYAIGQVKTLKQLREVSWSQLLLNVLDWSEQQRLESNFPSQFVAPTGARHKYHYHEDGSVSLSIRMQELYGLKASPSLAQGKLPVILKILSPAQRPIQQTADLAGFWRGSYKDVQKEMKGRYPKHFWPDDPANATATTRTKKNM